MLYLYAILITYKRNDIFNYISSPTYFAIYVIYNENVILVLLNHKIFVIDDSGFVVFEQCACLLCFPFLVKIVFQFYEKKIFCLLMIKKKQKKKFIKWKQSIIRHINYRLIGVQNPQWPKRLTQIIYSDATNFVLISFKYIIDAYYLINHRFLPNFINFSFIRMI